VALARRSSRELVRTLTALEEGQDDTALIVHYANYAYSRRGVPLWLARGLGLWKLGSDRRRLVTIFHEVEASGPPWRSSFWLQRLQRQVARRVARLSDAAITSLDLYAAVLGRALRRERLHVRPVFSTVGEPDALPPLAERERRLVVFGGRGARGRAYGPLLPVLAAAVRGLSAVGVDDIGPPLESVPPTIAGVPVQRLGLLDPPQVSRRLGRAVAGFVAYPRFFLPKSTIFAAYAAHGLLPVSAWPEKERPGGELRPGAHFWSPLAEGLDGDLKRASEIAGRAHAWYGGHSLRRQIDLYHELLA
jgi:hypothetical protein